MTRKTYCDVNEVKKRREKYKINTPDVAFNMAELADVLVTTVSSTEEDDPVANEACCGPFPIIL